MNLYWNLRISRYSWDSPLPTVSRLTPPPLGRAIDPGNEVALEAVSLCITEHCVRSIEGHIINKVQIISLLYLFFPLSFHSTYFLTKLYLNLPWNWKRTERFHSWMFVWSVIPVHFQQRILHVHHKKNFTGLRPSETPLLPESMRSN